MWRDPRPANRMGPFHGSQEERFAPGWNREYSPSLDSLAQERHSGNFSGRESLPYDIQPHTGLLNPQFVNREEPSFSFGARDGPHNDFRGREGHFHDFRGREYPPSDFQNRDDSQMDFKGREPALSEFRGREMYPGDFRDREGQSTEFMGGDIPSMDYRNREAFHMNYREGHTTDFRGRDDPPSEFRGRGTFDLDFRSRDGSHSDFRARDMAEQDYRGTEQSYSDFRSRDIPDVDFRGVGASDLDFRDRNTPSSDFRSRQRSRSDQDFRGRDVPPSMDFTDREMPPLDPGGVDFQPSQTTVPLADREHFGISKREESALDPRERSPFGTQKGEFQHSEPRAREEEPQAQHLETESLLEFQNSHGPLPDQNEPPLTFASKQQFSGDEQQLPDSSLGLKKEGDLDFLGRQDTDYRNIEYGDVDHRLPEAQLFDYEHGKSFPEGKPCKDSKQDLQDQDYRTCPKDVKPNKLIRLGGVPENATKYDILNAFQAPDGTPVKDLRLKDYCSGYNYGYVCVEFSLLEEAIGFMEANQGTIVIGGKDVTLEYTSCPEFWRCKRCKVSTVGYRSSCAYCRLPRDVTEAKLKKSEQKSLEEPKPENQPPEEQCEPQEPEPPKEEEDKEQWPSQEKKKEVDRYQPRKESQEHVLRREAKETTQQEEGESKTIMLKCIPRFTPPEVIVGLLAPYVRVSTSNVRVMKNKAGRMGYTYGFIELDSHAEAVRLVNVLQNLDPPIAIDGHTVDVNLATGKRRNDYGEQGDNPRYNYNQNKRGMKERRGGESQRRRSESPSDVSTYIYDPDTGNYFDPIAGVYYDPNSQREILMNQEAVLSPPRRKRHKSQDRTREREEPRSRDSRERRERTRNAPVKNEPAEEKASAEDVFKKPLPPTVKKEESAPPPKVVNPLIGLLGEYGGDSDNEEEEEEPQPQRPPVQREEQCRKSESEEDKLTDWNKLACLLCRRQFPNKEVLIKHQKLSELHKQNLEIHRKIKRSEQELAYLERREREGRYKEKGNDRRERFQEQDSPERKRPKYFRDSESDYKPTEKGRIASNNKGSRMLQAMGWKEGSGLGRNEQGMTSPVEAESRKKGAGLGTQGKSSKRQSNETYRDAVRRVMFARYKELE